jgi:16S rRNA processing protein RimM
MAEGQTDRIPVGYVRRAHGIRGDVVIRGLVTDAKKRLVPGASFLSSEDPPRTLTVESVGESGDDLRILFAEVSDRSAADTLKAVQITMPAGERRELSDDEWWPEDLVGCQVVDLSGTEIGVVREVIIATAQDRIVVENLDGDLGEVPFVDALVPTVDIANDMIVVDLPEGLFE